MNLQQFFLILRARYKVVLFTLLGTVVVTLVVSVLLPKEYTATASVVVDVKSPDPIAGVILPAMILPGYMATQVDIINSDRVAQKVVKLLRLDEDPVFKERWMEATRGKGKLEVWLAEILHKKLQVKPSRDSNVIDISYKAGNPDFAAAAANAFTHAYIDTNIELAVEPAKQYALWFGEQRQALRDAVGKAQAKLSEYQQQRGIVASDERLDNETTKLNELSSHLTIVQTQTSDAQSKQRTGNASNTLPEVTQNLLIQNLKAEIARQEAKLQEIGGNLGKNHPQYQRAESEIAALKQKVETETRNITSGFSTSRTVGKEKESELKAAIEAQKKKLFEIKRARDELAVLMRDVEAPQKAYDAVSQRFNQSRLESQSTQSNVAVLTPAMEPTQPSFPKIGLNSLIAVFLGTLLGVGAAFMLENLDRRIRSAEDLAEMLQLPVLSVIERSKQKGRFIFRLRRTAVAVRSAWDIWLRKSMSWAARWRLRVMKRGIQ